jgi:hypothetical protein
MNPKGDLLHIEKGQFADLQLDGKNLSPFFLLGMIENSSDNFRGYGKFMHG